MADRGFQLRRKLTLYGVAAALVHLASGCSSPPDDANRAPVEKPTGQSATGTVDERTAEHLVLAFGDSLYAGYGVQQNESFPAQLQALLNDQGLSVAVRGAGVSGDTTAAGRQRLAFVLDGLERTPDLVILGLGGNDMLRGLGPEETRANLDAMLTELDKRGIPVLLTGMVAAPNLGRDYAEAFNPIFPELAKKHGAVLYPFFLDGVVTDKALMLPDTIHPNAKGLERISKNIAPLVKDALSKSG